MKYLLLVQNEVNGKHEAREYDSIPARNIDVDKLIQEANTRGYMVGMKDETYLDEDLKEQPVGNTIRLTVYQGVPSILQ